MSVARPRIQQVRGQDLPTSIVREPSAAPIYFGPRGPQNNETAVHTEQVLAFSTQHYDHWAAHLGIERRRWNWCHWGENLTLENLDENDLYIGDRLQVGTNAVLEVTSPRIPCFKLAWRIGQPDQVLDSLIKTGWIGFYLRVLQPGWIASGDTVVLMRAGVRSITVGDLSRLLVDHSNSDLSLLTRVAADPALGSQAHGMIRKRINQLRDRALGAAGRWRGWRRFIVTEINDEALDTKSLRLCPADGGELPRYQAGQFLTVRVPCGACAVTRSWTLSEYPAAAGSYRVTVKRIANGQASVWVHDRLKQGDALEVRPPEGRFVLDRDGLRRVVLISAGIGITPLLAMLQAHVERGAEANPLLWIRTARNGASDAFKRQVEMMAQNFEFSRFVCYTHPQPQDRCGIDFDKAGRLVPDDIARLFSGAYRSNPFGRQIELPALESDVYVCGPTAFEAMVRSSLERVGVDPRRIAAEQFIPNRNLQWPINGPSSARVHFRRSSVTSHWRAQECSSLLELAERAGVGCSFSCRAGMCGSCDAGVVKGSVVYLTDPVAPPGGSRALLCCSVPATEYLEIDL